MNKNNSFSRLAQFLFASFLVQATNIVALAAPNQMVLDEKGYFEPLIERASLISFGVIKLFQIVQAVPGNPLPGKIATGELHIEEILTCSEAVPPKTIPFSTRTEVQETISMSRLNPWFSTAPKDGEKVFIFARKSSDKWRIEEVRKSDQISPQWLNDLKQITKLVQDKASDPDILLACYSDEKMSPAVQAAALRQLARRFPSSRQLVDALTMASVSKNEDFHYLAATLSASHFGSRAVSDLRNSQMLLSLYLSALKEFSANPKSSNYGNLEGRLFDPVVTRALKTQPDLATMVLDVVEKLPPVSTTNSEIAKELKEGRTELLDSLRLTVTARNKH